MSLNNKNKLSRIALLLARELRKSSTPAEVKMWELLRNTNFFNVKFYRQYPLFHNITGKESFFIADFYCPKAKLVIELDGVYHKYQLTKDITRTIIINSLGIRVVRFSNDDILISESKVIEKLIKLLK